ncbi:MAG TPA: ribose-phosphate diphosphokinase [Methanocella sp.]|uniref:ribose-phosphate diphosphokinase n=1 Tax=Methanocella sp. TaxID=2052833 RepID=UPI002C3CB44C|nr:ribose-phosphate diphosphokinase [Methanocella sp.]HTY90218.1 ribose-phosphate diphosphokinase [Methanocella sp.]
MSPVIIAGSSHPGMALSIAQALGAKVLFPVVEKFPDGETHVVAPSINGTVVYVQTMHPYPNEMLMEMEFTADLLKELGAERIVAVVPYLAYTRQDTRHMDGEGIAVKTMLRMLEKAGVNDIVSVDLHLHRLGLQELSGMTSIRIHEVSAVDALAKESGRYLKKPVVVGPDAESERWAKRAAELLDSHYDVLEKNRISPTEIEIRPKTLDVKGQDVLIIDDIVSTGDTIKKVVESLRAKGANKIAAAFTHGVLSGEDAAAGLYRAGATYLISTNTINNEFSRVDVGPVIAQKLKEIL